METINALGKPCPLPVIEMKRALSARQIGDTVSILVDNQAACQNLEKLAKGKNHGFSVKSQADNNFLVTLTKGVTPEAGADETGLVVAFGSNMMGSGSEELGKMLMKSYIFSLTELDAPPEHLLFFNAGIFLTSKDSTALVDLTTLVQKGTSISTCGACLNFYEKSDSLAIGEVTNMFSIASTMAQAKKCVNLC